MKDLDALALALPEVTKELEEGRPSYSVAGKTFCFHRAPRPDALDQKQVSGSTTSSSSGSRTSRSRTSSSSRGSVYFTTPHWNGYSAVLVRIRELKKLRKAELRDRVEEAWLKRARRSSRRSGSAR